MADISTAPQMPDSTPIDIDSVAPALETLSNAAGDVAEAVGQVPSLIHPDQHWLILAVIVAGVALSIYLEQTYRWAARVSGPLLALVIAMILANTGIMPREAEVYSLIYGHVVPLAIPLLLFRANVFRMFSVSRSLFIAFHIATVGTLLGAVVAFVTMRTMQWEMAMLPESVATMAASYIGGGINFVAVSNTYNVPEDIRAPLLVADNFVMAAAFVVLLVVSVSRFVLSQFPHPHTAAVDPEAAKNLAAEHWKRKDVGLMDIAKALAIAFAVTGGAMTLAAWYKGYVAGSPLEKSAVMTILFNPYVIITFVMLFIATVFHRGMSRIHGADEMGTYLLYTFLFVIGLPANLFVVLRDTPAMFVLCIIIAMVNIVVTLGVGRLLRINLEDLIIAVNISLGGPPTGAAFAISKGWDKLILPALVVGIWGYVIGTALGILTGNVLMRF